MKKATNGIICVLLAAILTLASCTGTTNDVVPDATQARETAAETYQIKNLIGTPSDYSDTGNWVLIPEITYDVDTVYFYPTVYIGDDPDAPSIVPLDNEILRTGALRNCKMNEVAFSHCTNVFAPYYRQSNLTALAGINADQFLDFQSQEQRTDVYAALDYYFEHYNEGRPYILAGHSQGSMMLRLVLREYMQAHPAYYKNMVAAYVLGYSVTKDDLAYNPGLKFAEGADDTGVIVSWNIEGPGNKDKQNAVVCDGAISINPINWKRDDTYAPAGDNLGTYVADNTTGTYKKASVKADARVDTERGVVVCTTGGLPFISDAAPVVESFFGPESYHNGDYPFYLDNLKENVKLRSDRFLAEHKE